MTENERRLADIIRDHDNATRMKMGAPSERLLFRPTTANRKTGNIPTASIHHDHIARSCKGCPMAPDDDGKGGRCYARQGTASFSTKRTARAAERNPRAYSVDHALTGRTIGARFVRFTSIGDVGGLEREEVEPALVRCLDEGLPPIVYTSQWRRKGRDWLKGWAMASTYTLSAYLKATRAGWRATLVVPAEVIADHVEHGTPLSEVVEVNAVACPAQVGELTGRPVQCNDCGLCSVKHQASGPGVWFAEHGPRVRPKWRKRVEAAKERRRAAMRGDSCA